MLIITTHVQYVRFFNKLPEDLKTTNQCSIFKHKLFQFLLDKSLYDDYFLA